jgi:hypothetical protein
MRVTYGDHWADLKGVEELTSGDADAWEESINLSFELPEGAEDLEPHEVEKLARKSIKMDSELIHIQRDALLGVIITGWSLQGIPPPCEDVGSIKKMPLGLRREVEQAIQPHLAELRRRPDPKATRSSSSNGSSRAGRRSSRPALTEGRSGTS